MPTPSVLLIRKARVSQINHVTPELFTMSCCLDDRSDFSFQAGQWVYLHLLNETGESLARGAFSLASAPVEAKDGLEFGIKVYGRLTQTVSDMRKGDMIGIQGPFGVFTLPKQPAPLVFIAGGIGVTPLRSLIVEALASSAYPSVTLIWMGKSWDELLYHQDFLDLQARYDGRFLYHPSLTRDPRPDWQGWRGRLSAWMLDAVSVDWSNAEAYVCGPNPFMERTKALLAERGIAGKPRYHEERFD